MDTLKQFIQSNPDPRELKHALAVQMSQRGYTYREIRDVLQVSIALSQPVANGTRRMGWRG